MDELNFIIRRIVIHPGESLLAVLGIIIATTVLSGTIALIISYDSMMESYSKMPQARQIQITSAFRALGQGEAATRLDTTITNRNLRFSPEEAKKIMEENPSILTTYQARYMQFSTSRTAFGPGVSFSGIRQTQSTEEQVTARNSSRALSSSSTISQTPQEESSSSIRPNQGQRNQGRGSREMISPPVMEAPPIIPELSETNINEQVDSPLLEQIQGYMVSADFFTAYNLKVQEGSLFDDQDVANRTAVAVVGSSLSKKLFDDGVSIGKRIRLNNRIYRIIGVLAPYRYSKDGLAASFDDLIYVPILTAVRGSSGSNRGSRETFFFGTMDELLFALKEGVDIAQAVRAIEASANHLYGQGAITIQTSLGLMKREIQKRLNIIYLLTFLALAIGVAAIVNIFNLMIGRVSRRTKAIAVQRALGAPQRRVFIQIIMESATLSALGTVVGAFLGTPLGMLLQRILEEGQNRPIELSFKGEMVWFIALCVELAATLFAVPAALDGASTTIVDALREE